MNVTIYHNPRCSKSRQTLQLLTEQGIEANIVEYLNAPPATDELQQILNSLGMKPRELMRKNESIYKEANLNDASLSDEQLVAAMIEYPILIERPIVLANGKARIGRPPQSVLEIL